MSSVNLINALEERQNLMTKRIFLYLLTSTILTVCSYILALKMVPQNSENLTGNQLTSNSVSVLTMVVTVVLGFLSETVTWIYIVWALSLIPCIIVLAIISPKDKRFSVLSDNLRWIRLAMVAFIPVALFAVTWTSFTPSPPQKIEINNPDDVIMFATWIVIVLVTLFSAFKCINRRYFEIKLAVLQLIFLGSLFLSYNIGTGLIPHATLYGVLLFVAFGSKYIHEILWWVSAYDLDLEIIEELHESLQEKRGKAKLAERKAIKKEEIEILARLGDKGYSQDYEEVDLNQIREENHIKRPNRPMK